MTRNELIDLMAEPTSPADIYAKATGREDWAEKLNELIPQHMHGGMVRWLVFGIMPGGFLQAVLRNDLFDAVGKADDINRMAITNYVMFLYNFAPGGSRNTAHWKGTHPNEETE